MLYYKYLIISMLVLGFYSMPLTAEMHQTDEQDGVDTQEHTTPENGDDLEEEAVILDQEMQ